MIRWIIICAVFGIVGSILAQKKGRSQILWFILCAIVPLLVIAILLLPAIAAAGFTKKCPHCAEIVKEDATMCKYCGMGL
ncbi:MAG: zinc ribbon domain-containing protein [Saprospiraceae bacterium]|nr:zinc ribbon domain-containing protein [Saprospiraceae bacterium]MCF8250990.1 zinc ribbon domain-containing protein [Saprospiraceae bacterium]MCF8280319.1 zinc ribbon domain-containing protein [Bacteroidales bacterium]MCF8312846.1 zinc ribbon domain-containing protein [Saprospiraceae bacterium]MCF8441293.1 zinc ribbon domain-containing protein [Saprospiraceae bacterium]